MKHLMNQRRRSLIAFGTGTLTAVLTGELTWA